MKFGAFTVTPGVRLSKHSEYGNKTTASGVIAYDFNDITTMYVSYKEFFRAPYLYELYNPFYGSGKLNPEEGETKEIGLNTRIDDKTTFAAHYYQTDSDNLIGFNSDTWKYYNAGAERIKGWDVQLTKVFDKNLSVTAAYTHTYIAPTSAASNANRNGYIPKGQYDLSFNYEKSKFNGIATVKGVVDRPGNKNYENDVADSFKNIWTMDVALNYKPIKGMNIFLKANNIFDRMYTDMTYDMRQPGGIGWYSQPGRNFLVGIEYSWDYLCCRNFTNLELIMKIAFLHFDFCGGPQSANTEKILHGMKIAAAAGAEWILTPEMALQGYFMVKSEKKYVLASITNGSYEPFKEAAADLGVRLFLGCGEQEDNTAPHNSCVVIDQKGKVIAKHNKVKIVKWITENWAEPGNGFKVHCFDEVQTGLLVCADTWFAEHGEFLGNLGAELMVSIAAWPDSNHGGPPQEAWKRCSKAAGGIFVDFDKQSKRVSSKNFEIMGLVGWL